MIKAQQNTGKLTTRWNARQLSIMLTILALIIWTYSITQAKFEIGYYGLIGGFPALYFVALGILTIASAILWVSNENHGILLFLQLCFLVIAIWLAPEIVGGAHPLQQETYYDLGRIEYTIREGNINPKLLWEQSWPAGQMFWAMIIRVSGGTTDDFASWIPWLPFIWQIILFFPLLLFFRNTIGKIKTNYCWAAMWIFHLGSWSTETDTGSHVFGIFFVLSILAILTMTLVTKEKARSLEQRITTIIMYSASAIGHFLASLVSLGITISLWSSKRLKTSNLVILAVILVAAWSIYGAINFFETSGSNYFRSAFLIQKATESTFDTPFSGNPSHAAVAQIKIITAILFGVSALCGGLIAWRLKNNTYTDVTVAAIGAGSVIFIIAVGTGYEASVYQRFLLFLMPTITYFAVKLLYRRIMSVFLVLIALIILPLTFICIYGNQEKDYLSPPYFAGAYFVHDNTTHGYVTGDQPIGRMKYPENYQFYPPLKEFEWKNNELDYSEHPECSPHYISISSNERATYNLLYNQPNFIDEIDSSLNSATNINLIYMNTDLKLYIHEKSK